MSRRDFLKLAGLTFGGLAFSPYMPPAGQFDDGAWIRVASSGVENKGIPVYSKPTDESRIVRSVFRDNLLRVYEEVNSGTPGYNPVWYRVWGGYVHRAHMQKVQYIYNAPAKSIRETKQLAEVTVPYTVPLRLINKEWKALKELGNSKNKDGADLYLYYQSVHWIVGIDQGPDGNPWYSVLDDINRITYNVPATHMRLIPDEELAPISPNLPFEAKRIEVSRSGQTVTCYEYDQVVFHTTISSGLPNGNPGENGVPTITPLGDFHIEPKMPSKHMGNGSLEGGIDSYELLGIPWVCFFTNKGHAFHGTYWHDNFGVPMSHGCINMRSEEAKWLFRWSMPAAPADQLDPQLLKKGGWGTPVKVLA